MNILNNITIQDVRVFFSSNCCRRSEGEVEPPAPCQTSPQIREYFKKYNKQNVFAATITIGNRYYGQLSAEDKKRAILRHIADYKRTYPNNDFYYTFEVSASGALHAHGICTGYPGAFHGIFANLGSHNNKSESYKVISNIDSYWEYINKDIGKEKINTIKHNITKNKIKNKFPELGSRSRGGIFPGEIRDNGSNTEFQEENSPTPPIEELLSAFDGSK